MATALACDLLEDVCGECHTELENVDGFTREGTCTLCATVVSACTVESVPALGTVRVCAVRNGDHIRLDIHRHGDGPLRQGSGDEPALVDG